jgi:predicted flap endonuclease-1-like 5' DNA nuclease
MTTSDEVSPFSISLIDRASKTSTNSKTLVTPNFADLLITGIGAADIAKLKSSGICTVYAVQATTKRNLSKIKGLSDAKVDKIKEAVCKIFVPNP